MNSIQLQRTTSICYVPFVPSRNIYKTDAPDAYYHVYARGVSRQSIFNSPEDYYFFVSLFDRYLSSESRKNSVGIPYPQFTEKIELLAYCLMGNHFHMLIYQIKTRAMTELMRCVMTSYSGYFNFKYKRSGPLFESRYKASEMYLQHISRYIHLNPRYWKRYPYSSFAHYVRGREPDWLVTEPILGMFASRRESATFVADYEENKLILEEIKHTLADW